MLAKNLKNKRISLSSWLLMLYTAIFLSGCVSSSKYEELQAQQQLTAQQRDELSQQKSALESENQALQARIDEMNAKAEELAKQLEATNSELQAKQKQLGNLDKELKETTASLEANKKRLSETAEILVNKDEALKAKEAELAKASEYMKRTNVLYDQLVNELKGELEANQVKVQEMKDGINVNLSEEILFPSGSADLNEGGQKVITRVSGKLKGKEYQIIVAGFTDNIPIRGNLAKRYPTNWELAGARAASVVRLLQKSGIDSDKLIASSYGDNFPVATNETDEGRAQNRRIEIRLRPVK